jgi:hypothetical protein
MKHFILTIALFFAAFTATLSAQQLAFPGAEGFGRNTSGARGVSTPTVYHVTNLNDSGTGSFRDAVSQPGRIVVFDVSGVIKLSSRVVFSGNSYIAGQSAPGDGVIIYGDGVSFSGANNLIVRYLRIYMGKGGSSGKDASGVANGINMMFDHLSLMWGLDETFSVNWDSKGSEPGNITIQNSIIGQGIMTHSAGGLIQTDGGVSIIGCLYIDNKTRNPKIKGLNQYINNVVYNWSGSDGYIMGDTSADSWAWCEGNYFISGPNSGTSPFSRATASYQIYHNNNNNYVDGNRNGQLDGSATTTASYGSATTRATLSAFSTNIPQPHPLLDTIYSPQDALTRAIAQVGASLPVRSEPDAYVVNQLLSYGSKGALITNESANGIYQNVGVVSIGTKPADTDNDGMPDAWETANGLNPSSAADATQIAANGYLNIENYLNSINAPLVPYIRCASELKMTARTTSSINLSWKNNALESDEIELQYSTTNSNFQTLAAALPANTTSYSVSQLPEETTCYFRLITKKAGMTNSTPSEVLKTATEGTPALPYQSISPQPAVGSQSRFYTEVTFMWENETGPWAGNVSYDVFVGDAANNLTQIATNISDNYFVYSNATLTMNQTYYWRVDAKNSLGTTVGAVWNFIAGVYSFTSKKVDVGMDYNGSATVNAASGVLLVTGTKTYTAYSGTINEMKFSVSGGTVNESDGSYRAKGTTKIKYFDLTDAAHYVEATLTANSSTQNISAIKVNGTSSDVDASINPAVLFSDQIPFSTTSIIGYEEVEMPVARAGNTGTELFAPVGTKSFRLYRTATLSTVDEDLYRIGGTVNPFVVGSSGKNPRVPYVSATLELLSKDGDEIILGNSEVETSKISYYNHTIHNPDREQISLYNILGKLILTSSNSAINIGTLPAGIYIAKSSKGTTVKIMNNEQ